MYKYEDFDNQDLRELYLEYVNSFLTVEKFAEFYQISVKTAWKIIDRGRLLQI